MHVYFSGKGKKYRAVADKIVSNLHKHYQAAPDTHYGFLLLHSTGHHPGGSEIDVPLNYADYFYLEALARKEVLNMKIKDCPRKAPQTNY